MPKHSSNTRHAVLHYDTHPTSELHHPLRARVPTSRPSKEMMSLLHRTFYASWSSGKGGPAAYPECSSFLSASVLVLVSISLRL